MAIDPLRTKSLSAECVNEDGPTEFIRDFTYQFRPGSFYHLSGPEFGGKRLLLQILGLLLPPDSGEIIVDGSTVTDLDIDDLGEIRNRKYGFLFSSPFLLPAFTVLENVAMPLFKIAQVGTSEARVITEEILEIVGRTVLPSAASVMRRTDCVSFGCGYRHDLLESSRQPGVCFRSSHRRPGDRHRPTPSRKGCSIDSGG